MQLRNSERAIPYVFLLPFALFYLAFFIFPTVYSLWLSFYSYRGYGVPKFVGLLNFERTIFYGAFWRSAANTLFYLCAHFVPCLALAFLLALGVHEANARLRSFVKPVIFLPQIVAVVASALIFRVIFATNSGIINTLLGTKIAFTSDPAWVKWTVVILMIWRSTGWFFVIYLSGLTVIGKDLLESAMLDGASYARRVFSIVIPIMPNIFLFTFLMETMSTIKMFVEPNMITTGGTVTPAAARPIVGVLVENMNNGYFGQASATGWVLFAIIFALSMLQYGFFRKEEN